VIHKDSVLEWMITGTGNLILKIIMDPQNELNIKCRKSWTPIFLVDQVGEGEGYGEDLSVMLGQLLTNLHHLTSLHLRGTGI
jgi:hypothetical protein